MSPDTFKCRVANAPVSEERLRNTRAWAAARPGLSGSAVIVAAIDELLQARRDIVALQIELNRGR